jgi:DMSO/TMAO reductase YedYZ heme-binding membrane subunit
MTETFTPDRRVCAAQAGLTTFVAAIAVALAGQLAGNDFLDGWLLSTRYTARLSFFVFLFAYMAPVFANAPRGPGASLGRMAFELALSFAVAHVVHFGCILLFFAFKHEVPSAVGLVIGGTGYLLLFAMLITGWSWHETGGQRWRRLHAWAPHYLWFVMFVTYVSRVSERGAGWLPFVLLTLGALSVRVAGRRRSPGWQSVAEAR